MGWKVEFRPFEALEHSVSHFSGLQSPQADRKIHSLEGIRVFEQTFTTSICVSFVPSVCSWNRFWGKDVCSHMGTSNCYGVWHSWAIPDCLYFATRQGSACKIYQEVG